MRYAIPLLFVGLLAVACKPNNAKQTLPILGAPQIVAKTVNGTSVNDTVYPTIGPFKFVNQYGDSISNKSLDGDIYVADFFFTSCPSICPIMHRNMLAVYNEFKNTGNFKIISHTIDPKYDSVKVLKKYADKLGITGNTWWFLQGTKEETYAIADKSYLVAVKEDKGTPGGYIHSGYFVLIDKQKHIRGVYDGTNTDTVKKMISDIKILQSSPDQTITQ